MNKNYFTLKCFDVEIRDSVLIVRLDGGKHALMGLEMAEDLSVLLDSIESDEGLDAVVFTGKHPKRFIGHADVRWLQEGGNSIPKLGRGSSSTVARISKAVRGTPVIEQMASLTPLDGGMQLDKLHATFLRMNRCGVIFIAALNGSALGLGSEFAQANDFRLMADGDFFIGQPEVLLGLNPGGGGTQRLPRLVGNHRALRIMLEGRPLSQSEALEIGYIDEVVPPEELIDRAVELGRYLGSRPRGAIEAIKRAVYDGGSNTLEEGMHIERTEFIKISPSDSAQELMLAYMAQTERDDELPFYKPEIFKETLEHGSFSNNKPKQ